MRFLDSVGELLQANATFLAVLAAVGLGIWGARWFLLRDSLAIERDHRLPRQLILLGLSAIGVVAIILVLPVPNTARNQLLTALGLLASGIIALSSSTLVANAMAGVMLRATRSFRIGDFVRVGSHFGRVAERGLLDTEIQTEDRELTHLPNLYLITNPVTVVRSSGTLVSVSLSLGYDVHHSRIEKALIEAAKKAELQEPFVRVLELGNFSITYRVSGFLEDIKNLLTVQSNLCKSVLDSLHGQQIEIMSPTFMNQRQLAPDSRIIPVADAGSPPDEEMSTPENIMFDKAESAERIENRQLELKAEIEKLEKQMGEANKEERQSMEKQLEGLKQQLTALASARAAEQEQA